MNSFEFGIAFLHDQLEIMLENDQQYLNRIKELKKSKLKCVEQVNEYIDLKREHELLETEISDMIEFISFVAAGNEEYQKKKNAGAKATDKEKISKKIITEMKKNANAYSIICPGGIFQ